MITKKLFLALSAFFLVASLISEVDAKYTVLTPYDSTWYWPPTATAIYAPMLPDGTTAYAPAGAYIYEDSSWSSDACSLNNYLWTGHSMMEVVYCNWAAWLALTRYTGSPGGVDTFEIFGFSGGTKLAIAGNKWSVRNTTSWATQSYCVYDRRSWDQYTSEGWDLLTYPSAAPIRYGRWVTDGILRDTSYMCPITWRGYWVVNFVAGYTGNNTGTWWANMYNQGGSIPDIPNSGGNPPLNPVTSYVSGLRCTIAYDPIYSEVAWYTSYGSLPDRNVFREGESLIQTGSWAWWLDLDVMAIIWAWTWATLPIGSLAYTGTAYADVSSSWSNNAPPALYWWLKRGGATGGWNILEIHGVNTSGFFGQYGIFEWKSTDGITTNAPMYSSGSIATASLYNGRIGTTFNVFSPASGFSGVRVGIAPYWEYKFCSKEGINSCEWRIENGANVCGGSISQGFSTGICGITGSWSIYGSGACVPLVNSSGSIVDAGILPGQGIVVTNPDWSTRLVRIPDRSQDAFEWVFSCGIWESDRWWNVIGKALICPVTVAGNLFNRSWKAMNDIYESLVWVTDVIQTVWSWATYSGSTATWSSNPLISSLLDIQTETKNTAPTQIAWWGLIVFGGLFSLLLILLTIFNKN